MEKIKILTIWALLNSHSLLQRSHSFWSAPTIVTAGKVKFSEHAQSNGTKTLIMRLDGQNSVISKWLLPD